MYYLIGSAVGPSPYPEMVKEFQKISISNASIATLNSEKVAIEDKLEELLKNHFKQNPVAKWARKLTLEGLKLKSRSLFKKGVHAQIEMARKNNIKLSKAEIDKLWEDFYKFEAESGVKVNAKNYKRFWPTLAHFEETDSPIYVSLCIGLRMDKAMHLYNKIRSYRMNTWWD